MNRLRRLFSKLTFGLVPAKNGIHECQEELAARDKEVSESILYCQNIRHKVTARAKEVNQLYSETTKLKPPKNVSA